MQGAYAKIAVNLIYMSVGGGSIGGVQGINQQRLQREVRST